MKRKHRTFPEAKRSWSAEKIRWWVRNQWPDVASTFICVCGHLSFSHDLYVLAESPANIQGRKCLKKICICPKLCKDNLEYMEALYEAKHDNSKK